MLLYALNLYLFIAILCTSFFTTYMLSKGRTAYMKVFALLSLCLSIYLLGYMVELNNPGLERMLFWNQMQYIGLPFLPAFWLLFSLLYTRRVQALNKRTVILVFLIPCITFIMRLTNAYHGWYYTYWEVRMIGEFSILYLGKGASYYLQSAYVIASFVIAATVFYQEYKTAAYLERARFGTMFAASVIPYVGFLLIIIDIEGLGLDYVAFMVPISLAIMMFAFYRYDLLSIRTLAREAIFEKSQFGMILMDKEYRVLDFNIAAAKIFDGLNMSSRLITLTTITKGDPELTEAFAGTEPKEIVYGTENKVYELTSSTIRDTYGNTAGVLKSIRDVTEMKALQERLNILASVDELSGLYNRRTFMEHAQNEFERAKRYRQDFSVLMMDLDHFKRINDTYGHSAGDEAIRAMSGLIRQLFRKSDICGRLGGEEFAVLLTNTSLEDACRAAELFRDALAKLTISGGDRFSLTISIGAAGYKEGLQSIEDILKLSDEALYMAKAQGRNRTVAWTGAGDPV